MRESAIPLAGDKPAWLSRGDGFVMIELLARPRSSRRCLVGAKARGLVIAIDSPPDKGKANDELIAMIARELKIARSEIAIVRGAATRHKLIRMATDDSARCAAQLGALAATATAGVRK
jgi:uncharacterized protein